MDDRYKALLLQTADVMREKLVTRNNRRRAHAVILDFIKAHPGLTYSEIAEAFGLHPVTVNRLALEAGEKRGRGRRPTKAGVAVAD